jgi:hypothetical protein
LLPECQLNQPDFGFFGSGMAIHVVDFGDIKGLEGLYKSALPQDAQKRNPSGLNVLHLLHFMPSTPDAKTLLRLTLRVVLKYRFI